MVRFFSCLVFLVALGCATSSVDTGRDGPDAGMSGGDAGSRDGGGPAGDGGPSEACAPGESDTCTTPCASVGLRVCTAGFFGPCVPPAEDCNGGDDDCDGAIDEITERTCSAECGGGVERCEAGAWTGCTGGMPRAEICDSMDNDCDSGVDEGVTQPCTSACGMGTETCVAGTFAGCTAPRPGAETCDGTDEDCDGRTDEALMRACTTACGMGTETCTGGTFGGCTAPAPMAETCDRADEDCDGTTDEGWRARGQGSTYTTLRTHHPGCDGSAERFGPTCNAAIHRFCRGAMSCWTSGFGPVENSGDTANVVCVVADVRMITYAIAATHHPACDGSNGPLGAGCRAAYNRYCRSEGFEGGFGSVEDSASNVQVSCVPRAHLTRRSTTFTVLRTHHPVCDGSTERIGPSCNAAINRLCSSMGFEGGFGPVEMSGDNATVNCVSR